MDTPILANDLRAAVLQAAISGKLTKQLDTDSSIDDLLTKITLEKEQLIKDKRIKKEKILPLIAEEELQFEIPKEWKWVYLQNISKEIIAGGDKPKNFSKTETELYKIPVISNGETNDGIFGYTDKATICEKAITVSGRGTIGFSKVREPNFTPIVRLIVIKSFENLINYDYLVLVLTSLLEKGNGSAVKQLTVPMIVGKYIPLPPIEEQQRIVERVEELMAKIDEYEKIEKQLVELKKEFLGDMRDAILQAAMQGKLTEQKLSDLAINISNKNQLIEEERFEIPNNWSWCLLRDLVSINTGKKDQNYATIDGKYNFYTCAKEVFKAPNYSFEGEALILPGNGANVGEVTLYNGKFEAYQRTYVLQSKINDLNMKYLFYSLKENWKQYNSNKMFGSAIPYIKLGNLQNYPIPLPPIEEQQRIVDILDKLLPLCDELI